MLVFVEKNSHHDSRRLFQEHQLKHQQKMTKLRRASRGRPDDAAAFYFVSLFVQAQAQRLPRVEEVPRQQWQQCQK